MYGWQPATSYPELMTQAWAYGTGWSGTGNTATKVAGTAANWSQNILNAALGGFVYRVTFTASPVTAGTVKIQINAGTPTPAVIDVGSASVAISKAGTYSRLIVMPANAKDIILAADAAFAGTIANVSLKLENRAFIIPEAPRRIGGMFVDPHRVIVLYDTFNAIGKYNPLLLRWSGLENHRLWIPDATNFSGEIGITSGGRIVSALPSRDTNLVWTDVGLSAMQFTTTGFNVKPVAGGCGLIGKHAVVENNGIAYWYAADGNQFKTTFDFQGPIPQLIDNRISKDAHRNLVPSQADKVFAYVNSAFSEIGFMIPDQRDSPPIGLTGANAECSRSMIYQLSENHWTKWTDPISSWVPSGVFPYPIACGTDGRLYYMERGITDNGADMPNYLITSYFDIEEGGDLMETRSFIPDFQGQSGNITLIVRGKLYPNGPVVMERIRTVSPTTLHADMRVKARQTQVEFRSTKPWRAGAWRFEAKKSGARR